MGKLGKVDLKGMKEFQKKLEKQQKEADAFLEGCAKELAARLLRLVVMRTPVGNYSHEIEIVAKQDSKHHKKGDVYKKRVNPGGKMGGTLRRGWVSVTQEETENGKGAVQAKQILEYVHGLQISRSGSILKIEIINPVEYAAYVEYGHRTPGGKGWVRGQFMMTISEQELQTMAPQLLERKIKKFLEGGRK